MQLKAKIKFCQCYIRSAQWRSRDSLSLSLSLSLFSLFHLPHRHIQITASPLSPLSLSPSSSLFRSHLSSLDVNKNNPRNNTPLKTIEKIWMSNLVSLYKNQWSTPKSQKPTSFRSSIERSGYWIGTKQADGSLLIRWNRRRCTSRWVLIRFAEAWWCVWLMNSWFFNISFFPLSLRECVCICLFTTFSFSLTLFLVHLW